MLRPNRRGPKAPQLSRSFLPSSVRLLLLAALVVCWAGRASAQSPELVQYPSEEVAFICGPQLKANSPSNPFPWFDKAQIEHGHIQGRAFAAVAPRVLTGTVSVRQGSSEVEGVGTRFTREVDPNGPAPHFNGWFRVKMPDGNFRETKVASVISDTRLVLTTAWTGASVSGAQADTQHQDPSWGWNQDRYYDSAYYDMALVQYINYYRTGDPSFLAYARKVADSWWGSPYIDHGTVTSGANNLPPRSMAYAGLMLRALDGRPEMWDYLQRQARAAFDNWVGQRVSDPTLYYDIREDGYAQLYAALLAKVLPDSYDAYPQGTLSPAAGRVTDGAQKRASFLRDAGRAAVEFFGRLQRPDGSWRWDVEGMGLVNIEQPFMLGIYLEAVAALDRVTQDPAVRASLRTQLEKAVRHLYTQAYRGNETVSDLPQYRWRGVWYFWGGGTKEQPTLYERGEGQLISGGSTGMIKQVRHLNSTLHQAFGYAYAVTGDGEYLRMGEEMFDASYGDRVDGIRSLADDGRGKNYAMNFRASGRYLVGRLSGAGGGVGAGEPAAQATSAVGPAGMIASAFSLARELSESRSPSEARIKELLAEIESARRAFSEAAGLYVAPEGVLSELDAALTNARTALAAARAGMGSDGDTASVRVGWAAARLKRAAERVKRR